jgi:hypothetical protein
MSGLTCFYCGLTHHLVEAGGVHYCPNRLCTGPGSWSHRKDLKSYKELDGGGYTVDPREVLDSVRANTNPDPNIWAAECRAVAKWMFESGGDMPKVGTDS